MKKNFLTYFSAFFVIFLTFFGNSEKIFAEIIPTENNPDFTSYENNIAGAKKYCDDPSQPWAKNSALVTIPQYPKLEASAVNGQIERTKNLSTLTESEKERLQADLDLTRIGNFSGFKTLEVARLQYRASMDSLFSCSVVTSRLKILSDLQETISGTFTETNSEIKQQLEKEKMRLERERDKLGCNADDTKGAHSLKSLSNSATRQYCHYRYYLTYLESALDENRTNIERIEQSIGTGTGTLVAGTTSEWAISYNTYKNSLEREINRADTSLPRAFKAFRDMEKAYGAHLMLTIIYDDYIRLRKNLSTYMNASTQLYLKSYNAQDANNR